MSRLASSPRYKAIKASGQLFKRGLYPPECLMCRHSVSAYYGFCGACWSKFHFVPNRTCQSCAAQVMGADIGPLSCEGCWDDPPPWDRAMAYFYYKHLGRTATLQLKHADRLDLARAFGERMAIKWRGEIGPNTWIIPVPMHWRRMFWRGANSANELAKWVAGGTSGVFEPNALVRKRHTPTLDERPPEERHALLQDAFDVPRRYTSGLSGRHVVLVDDVMTTGATLRSASTQLLQIGAARIDIMVLARATQTA